MKKQVLGSTKQKRSPQEGEAPAQVLDVDATCWVPTRGRCGEQSHLEVLETG